VPRNGHNRHGRKTAREADKKTSDFYRQNPSAGVFVFGEVAIRHEKALFACPAICVKR
jgi:hypothetical protein